MSRDAGRCLAAIGDGDADHLPTAEDVDCRASYRRHRPGEIVGTADTSPLASADIYRPDCTSRRPPARLPMPLKTRPSIFRPAANTRPALLAEGVEGSG